MAVLQEFKCPCCDGAIEFDTTSQRMKCPYCDTEFDVDSVKSYNEGMQNQAEDNMTWEQEPGEQWQEDETTGLRTYVCQSCGGEIVGDEHMAATACPFCDNPVVLKGQFSGDLKPDLVIPFKLDKKAAKEALKKHYMGKRLLPKVFKDENHLDEIKGVYVPFWLFDAVADGDISYKATRVRSWSDSRYYYTETSHYSVARAGTLAFRAVPVDGSSKIDDTLMESLEPFDMNEAVAFNAGYLAGYMADKYDVDSQHSMERVNQRIKKSTEDKFAATAAGYSTLVPVSSGIKLKDTHAKYALYPVWLLNTTWKGKKYTFAMNGQTGKMVGDLPMDNGAYCRWLFGIAGLCTAACFLISILMWLL